MKYWFPVKVIPAIDLLNGKVVRLHKGDYAQATIYNDNPLNEARKFKEAGFQHIHVVDLNGAREGSFVNLDYIREIMEETGLSIQTGGGIRTYDDAMQLLDHGVDRVICSSMAVKNRSDWYRLLEKEADRVILGMDLKNGKVAYGGWMETSDQAVDTFLTPMIERGLNRILSTDISRDGTLQGPNFELYQSLQQDYAEIDFIASGGVATAKDLESLAEADLFGVVVGRAYYEEKISLAKMAKYHG